MAAADTMALHTRQLEAFVAMSAACAKRRGEIVAMAVRFCARPFLCSSCAAGSQQPLAEEVFRCLSRHCSGTVELYGLDGGCFM